jgi:hypothetical protein
MQYRYSCWGQLTTKGTDSSEGALKIYISILHCPVYSDLTIVAIVRSEYTGQCNIDIYIFSAPSEESVPFVVNHGFL